MQRLSELLGPLVLLGLVSLGYGLRENEPCTNPVGESGRCIYFEECEPVFTIFKKSIIASDERRFLEQSRCGKTNNGKHLVCCVVSAINPRDRSNLPKPPSCGVDLSDRIFGGQITSLDEFPWMALIQYRSQNGQIALNCGATLINSRYVLTAAHCVTGFDRISKTIRVRLGEWDLDNEEDCVNGECADMPVDMDIEKIIVHENYTPDYFKEHYNDIALIRFTRDVKFSSFISPICLPIDNEYRTRNIAGTKGWAAGWGATETKLNSNVKLKVELQILDSTSCDKIYKSDNAGVTIRDTQICAIGVLGQHTCYGDSGGPLTKLIRSNHFQYGIVSFGVENCNNTDLPGGYTNVANYIDWIESNIQ